MDLEFFCEFDSQRCAQGGLWPSDSWQPNCQMSDKNWSKIKGFDGKLLRQLTSELSNCQTVQLSWSSLNPKHDPTSQVQSRKWPWIIINFPNVYSIKRSLILFIQVTPTVFGMFFTVFAMLSKVDYDHQTVDNWTVNCLIKIGPKSKVLMENCLDRISCYSYQTNCSCLL